MTKEEFLSKFNKENINTGEYILVLDKITDDALVMGCAFDQGLWKVYKTKERGGHYIIKEFSKEEMAFQYFYKFLCKFSEGV